MKTIPLVEAVSRSSEIASVLDSGGLACVPINGSYRLLADATCEAAIVRIGQTKRRAKNHPALVLVTDASAARTIVHGMAWPTTKRLIAQYWPGALTLALPPSHDLAPKVRKLLARATGTIGVRASADPLASAILEAFGRPVVASSANVEAKSGASSAASVQQRLGRAMDLWVDAGDMTPAAPSTIVALTESSFELVREGAIAADDIAAALERAA